MNERIKKLRKALDLTQQAFADRIGTTQNSLAGYETGRRNPSSSVINNICKEFHVNEEWLRTGSGGMFQKLSRDAEIEEFVNNVLRDESAEFKRRLIAALAHLDAAGWDALEQLIEEMSRSHEQPADQHTIWEAEADEFAAIAREQFLSEKLRESQALSAKESGGPGGVA